MTAQIVGPARAFVRSQMRGALTVSFFVLACAQPSAAPVELTQAPTEVDEPDPARPPSGAQNEVAEELAAVASEAVAEEPAPHESYEPYDPFEGLDRVPLSALWPELEAIARDMEDDPVVRAEYAELVRTHGLGDTPSLRRDHARVKLVFEATRDGGLWNLRWAITNRKPRSTEIWSQWSALAEVDEEQATAVAECDELSALFAVVARRLGVDRIGLLWPVWNHVVAVWTVRDSEGNDVRLVVPTSQIFLSPDATLGTDGFDPWKQKTIYTYRSRDVSDRLELPASLASFFVQRAHEHASRPRAELQRERNERSARLGGS